MSLHIRADDGTLSSNVLPLYVKTGHALDTLASHDVVLTYWHKGRWEKEKRCELIRKAKQNKVSLKELCRVWGVKWENSEELANEEKLPVVACVFFKHSWWDEISDVNGDSDASLRKQLCIPAARH